MANSIYDKIAIIVIIIICFIVGWSIYIQINEHYTIKDPKLKDLEHKFKQFFSRERKWKKPLESLNNTNIMSNLSFYRGNKSYTINKKNVYICLKDKDGEYYDDNMLIYVIAHEIAHTICPEIGHTELFHTIFDALLLVLIEEGVYDPTIPILKDYCVTGDNDY